MSLPLYDKVNPVGVAVLTAIFEPIVGSIKVTTDLTPPGSRYACIKFKRVFDDDPRWNQVIGALNTGGLWPDILDDGYRQQIDTAFVGEINTAMLPPGELRTKYFKE